MKFRSLPPFLGGADVQVDFAAFPIYALQKYKHHYDLNSTDGPPVKKAKMGRGQGKKRGHHEESDEEMSNSEDESPYRIDLGAWRPRINKPELAKMARAHFSNLPPARENDTIVQFLYAVKTQGRFQPLQPKLTCLDKVLKLRPD